MDRAKLKSFLEGMYYVYARRELIYPDPLHFLYNYDNVRDREVVGLITSSLAYGRVSQIMKSCEKVLACLGARPYEFVLDHGDEDIVPSSFKHRFTTSADMNNYLHNISGVLRDYGSIEAFMGECLKTSGGEMLSSLDKFASRLSSNKSARSFPLVSSPRNGSTCKRLFLFLRWLVRSDLVDPGGWTVIKPSQLIIPLDTHLFHISKVLELTSRNFPDFITASLITNNFLAVNPLDPVKYDFSLSRFGIRQIKYYHKFLLT